MPIPVGDRPFDLLAAELVADQCAANPTLGSVLGLTEYDEALPDLSADGIAATQRAEDAWVARLARPRRQRADRRRADRPRPGPDGPARPGPDARLGRLAAQPRPLRRHRALLGVRAAHHPAAARARAGGSAVAARLRGTPGAARAGQRPTSTRRWPTRRCCAGPWARSAPARPTPGRSPTSSTTRRPPPWCARPASWPRRRTSASASTSRRWSTRPPATGRSASSATTPCCGRPRASATAPGSCASKGQAAYDELAADMTRAGPVAARDRRLHRGGQELQRRPPRDAGGDARALPRGHRRGPRVLRRARAGDDARRGSGATSCRRRRSAAAMLAVAHYMLPPPFAPADAAARGRRSLLRALPAGRRDPGGGRRAAGDQQPARRLVDRGARGLPRPPLAPRLAVARTRPAARRPLRFVLGSTYFVEGWGLYTEDLLREQGFFSTPEQELCQRDFRLFRAARIIVDTSLHLGEMTIEEAVDFMSTKASLSPETAAGGGAPLLRVADPGVVLPHRRPGDRPDARSGGWTRRAGRCATSTTWPPAPAGCRSAWWSARCSADRRRRQRRPTLRGRVVRRDAATDGRSIRSRCWSGGSTRTCRCRRTPIRATPAPT